MSKQTFMIIVIVLALGGLGLWFFYSQSSSPTPDQAADTTVAADILSANPDIQQIERELVDLRRLKDLELDTSILQNPFLASLEAPRTLPKTSTTTPGRPNPFLPL